MTEIPFHLSTLPGMEIYPVMSTLPCQGSFLQRLLHLGFLPYSPFATFTFQDAALLTYQLNTYFNFMLMVTQPRLVSC